MSHHRICCCTLGEYAEYCQWCPDAPPPRISIDGLRVKRDHGNTYDLTDELYCGDPEWQPYGPCHWRSLSLRIGEIAYMKAFVGCQLGWEYGTSDIWWACRFTYFSDGGNTFSIYYALRRVLMNDTRWPVGVYPFRHWWDQGWSLVDSGRVELTE